VQPYISLGLMWKNLFFSSVAVLRVSSDYSESSFHSNGFIQWCVLWRWKLYFSSNKYSVEWSDFVKLLHACFKFWENFHLVKYLSSCISCVLVELSFLPGFPFIFFLIPWFDWTALHSKLLNEYFSFNCLILQAFSQFFNFVYVFLHLVFRREIFYGSGTESSPSRPNFKIRGRQFLQIILVFNRIW